MAWSDALQLALGGALLAITLALAAQGFRCFRRARAAAFFPHRSALQLPSEWTDRPDLRRVTFVAAAGDAGQPASLAGWYVPSVNGAAVVFAHGSGADRRSVAAEAWVLARRGFGVLLFDWPGHGESTGVVRWNAGERLSLTAAIDFVAAQPETRGRVGVFGFSMGGYFAAQVALDDRKVSALALAGTPTRLRDVVRWQFRRWGPIGYLPALLAYCLRAAAISFDVREAVARLGARPLLIIHGLADSIVPVAMAREIHAAAASSAHLLLLAGVDHGNYTRDPTFAPALSDFFEASLLAGAR